MIRFNVSISLDGFLAGPAQSLDAPLGIGGEDLHAWAFPNAGFRRIHGDTGGEVNASTPVIDEMFANVGAIIMGRNMFGGGTGAWATDPAWTGWWGPNPPYHVPVFVLTHHARAPLVCEGDTTFTFVTDGIERALAQARAAAGAKDILIAGGARAIQQYLAAGHVDEINISIAPVFLHGGERLFDQLPAGGRLEQLRAVEAPGVTHLKYRVVR
jgi:dihydrofolate reductase